jgi:RNA polymerase sigma-70 factor, ECF subfamily
MNCVPIEEKIKAEKQRNAILSLSNGNKKAFDWIYDQYSEFLYNFVFGFLKNKEESEEVVQEVFIKIWTTRTQLNPEKSIKSFIFTLAKNMVFNKLKKMEVEEKHRNSLKNTSLNIANDIEENINFEELTAVYHNAINNLPTKRREIYLLNREEELSYKEIAMMLHISVNTVKDQISKALKEIRKIVKLNHPV